MTSPKQLSLAIALMLETDGPGGAEEVVFQLAGALRDAGHTVYPFGPADGVGWLGDKLRSEGFEVHTFDVRSTFDLSCMRRLAADFRRLGVDLVHCHEFTTAIYGAAASRMRGIPHVITMHGGRYYDSLTRRRLALKLAVRSSRAVTAVSRATAQDLETTLNLRPGTVTVVPNGIQFQPGDRERGRHSLGLAHDELLILSVGNLYPVKGHRVLLEALKGLLSFESRWRLAIAGRGDERDSLESYASEHGLAGRLMLLGVRGDIPDLLAAADIFVMPSLSEGMPLALVEAMLSGKAIIATDVGGIPEMVSADSTALLVPPGDPGALAGQLGRLLQYPELRSELGAAAARTAEAAYRREVMAQRYVDLYRGGTKGGAEC